MINERNRKQGSENSIFQITLSKPLVIVEEPILSLERLGSKRCQDQIVGYQTNRLANFIREHIDNSES